MRECSECKNILVKRMRRVGYVCTPCRKSEAYRLKMENKRIQYNARKLKESKIRLQDPEKKAKLYQSSSRNYKYRIEKNPILKVANYLRGRLYQSLKTKSWRKTSKFSEYIGCSLEELRSHLESQFKPGMTWENHGQWHIDHIYPLSLAKNQEHLIELSHYTNLQPLWAKENLSKSNRVTS